MYILNTLDTVLVRLDDDDAKRRQLLTSSCGLGVDAVQYECVCLLPGSAPLS